MDVSLITDMLKYVKKLQTLDITAFEDNDHQRQLISAVAQYSLPVKTLHMLVLPKSPLYLRTDALDSYGLVFSRLEELYLNFSFIRLHYIPYKKTIYRHIVKDLTRLKKLVVTEMTDDTLDFFQNLPGNSVYYSQYELTKYRY
jgi:hypothetical protein